MRIGSYVKDGELSVVMQKILVSLRIDLDAAIREILSRISTNVEVSGEKMDVKNCNSRNP